MKILYIVRESKPDYQCDMIFHGLYTTPGIEVIDSKRQNHMYNDIPDKSKLYGRGFTIFATLTEKNTDRENLEQKIKDKYFDLIIYGSIHRCDDYFDIVEKVYPKNKIIFIDGEDILWFNQKYIGKGIYFKREMTKPGDTVFPIQFCFPKEKICQINPIKEKYCAHVLPGNKKTYIYTKEEDYYCDYQISKFAWTRKKGGWDCLRHYEIIANKCLPFFLDIEGCPKNIMFRWPKELNKTINQIYRTNEFTDKIYEELQFAMGESLNNFLTTEKMVQYILEFVK